MKIGWYFHRLRAMTASEMARRVAERWKHRSDAVFAESVRGIALGKAVADVPALPAPGAAPEFLRGKLAADAAEVSRGDWKLFGWRAANVGTPPQWHRDVTCGVDIPADGLAHRINHRALPGGADARTIWEINRWSEAVRLAMHDYVNGDRAAVITAVAWLEDWCDRNPSGYGINWTSPLEAGLRLINFVWFDALARRRATGGEQGAEALARLEALCQRVVPAHAAWVWRYRSYGSSANNHLLGELVGLLFAVKRWPALEPVLCPAEALWREISHCVLEQFEEDGGNREQALHYHLFAWEMAWHAVRLMRVTDGPVVDRLQRAAVFFSHMAHESDQWEYGDNDEAQIVPLTLERENAVAEWRAWMRGQADGGALAYWFGLPPSDGGRMASEGGTPNGGWWLATESGMAACERDGWKLRVDASPLGFGKLAAHGHADALHLSIWDGPHALVIDPGTGGYFGSQALREELADWDAHNGPRPVDGYQTPVRLGTFLWSGRHAVPELRCEAGNIVVSMAHEGWRFTRRVTCGRCEVETEDREAAGREFQTRWTLAPECSLRRADDGEHDWLIERSGRRWGVSCDGPARIMSCGECDVAPHFGGTTRAPNLIVKVRGVLQMRMVRL